MEATAEKLELRFKEANTNIDLLTRKLSVEFQNAGDDEEKRSNPGEMLKKLSDIKKEYADIVQEARAIKDAQEEAMKFFKDELQTMCATLTKLQMNSGMEGAESSQPTEMSELSKMLGIPLPAEPSEASAAATSSPAVISSEPASVAPSEAGDVMSPKSEASADDNPDVPEETEITPFDRRKSIGEFLPLSKEEFESVSDLVRGRAKLVEVNQTYRLLWQHFKEEGNSDPLTSQEMFKMGLRVTGQTGEAKLKILRSLKLLKMMKSGAVLLT